MKEPEISPIRDRSNNLFNYKQFEPIKSLQSSTFLRDSDFKMKPQLKTLHDSRQQQAFPLTTSIKEDQSFLAKGLKMRVDNFSTKTSKKEEK